MFDAVSQPKSAGSLTVKMKLKAFGNEFEKNLSYQVFVLRFS